MTTAAQAAGPVLEMDGVSRAFGRRRVLRDVHLRIAPDRLVALHGANGAGKTTLLRIAATDLRPTDGTVRIAGIDAVRDPVRARRHLGVLLQDAPVYAQLTPLEHVRWWTRLHRRPVSAAEGARLLADAGLHAAAPAGTLSRGQRQRLALVMAMAPRPALLLLDEPFTALDADGAAWLTARLADRPQGQAVLLIDHDAARAAALADEGVHLEQGVLGHDAPVPVALRRRPDRRPATNGRGAGA